MFYMYKSLIYKGMALGLMLGAISACNSDKPLPAIDLKNLDLSVNPQVDFYQYANGGWRKSNPLPEEYSRYGSFDKLQEDNDKMLHSLVEELAKAQNPVGSVAEKIGNFYASGMDIAKIESNGTTPLKPFFDQINAAASLVEIQKIIASFHKMGINPLFNFYGEPDSKNSSMMIGVLYQGGLGLSDRDYYISNDKRAIEIRTEYLSHLRKVFTLLGNTADESSAKANRIFDLETQLAKASFTRLEERDPERNYNKKTIEEVKKLYPSINWDTFFEGIGIAAPAEINVAQLNFFLELNLLLPKVEMATWKDYLAWNLLQGTSNYLSSVFVEEHFNFYGKFLSGQPKIKPRWKRVLSATNGTVGEAVGQIFVEKYFPAEAKQRMLNLVENLRASLAQRIEKLPWMGDSTKLKALEKLAAIRVKIG